MAFTPPERDIHFLLHDVFRLPDEWQTIPALADFTADVVDAVIQEGGRVASEVLSPLNQVADSEGCTWNNGVVTTPSGFREGFASFVQGGWLGLSGNPQYDGQGMPKTLGCLVEEMFWAANPSLYLYGTLSVGAALCIDSHGTAAQKAMYLPRLYSGEWTGTMCLTEAQCRYRPRHHPYARRTTCRRILQHYGYQDFHYQRRARSCRQHHSPGSRAFTGFTFWHQGHLTLHRAEVPAR